MRMLLKSKKINNSVPNNYGILAHISNTTAAERLDICMSSRILKPFQQLFRATMQLLIHLAILQARIIAHTSARLPEKFCHVA